MSAIAIFGEGRMCTGRGVDVRSRPCRALSVRPVIYADRLSVDVSHLVASRPRDAQTDP